MTSPVAPGANAGRPAAQFCGTPAPTPATPAAPPASPTWCGTPPPSTGQPTASSIAREASTSLRQASASLGDYLTGVELPVAVMIGSARDNTLLGIEALARLSLAPRLSMKPTAALDQATAALANIIHLETATPPMTTKLATVALNQLDGAVADLSRTYGV